MAGGAFAFAAGGADMHGSCTRSRSYCSIGRRSDGSIFGGHIAQSDDRHCDEGVSSGISAGRGRTTFRYGDAWVDV